MLEGPGIIPLLNIRKIPNALLQRKYIEVTSFDGSFGFIVVTYRFYREYHYGSLQEQRRCRLEDWRCALYSVPIARPGHANDRVPRPVKQGRQSLSAKLWVQA